MTACMILQCVAVTQIVKMTILADCSPIAAAQIRLERLWQPLLT